jgi:hypothetical protein
MTIYSRCSGNDGFERWWADVTAVVVCGAESGRGASTRLYSYNSFILENFQFKKEYALKIYLSVKPMMENLRA